MSPEAFSSPEFLDAQALAERLTRPIVFVDLETTGGNATHDRITEIGVVEVSRAGVEHWSVLVDPQESIPPFIQQLTGITNDMVSGQPSFASLAEALAERLEGKLFVAHNARFDYGFLKNEFKRAGIQFKADVLCTVRLSRHLFPSVQRHGLDALIARFGLEPAGRHRALADADLLWQFWQRIHELYSVELIDAAIKSLIKRASTPPQLPDGALDEIPATPGVYLFYGENDLLLYIGKSVNLKQRVASHFSGDHRIAKDLRLSQEIRRIEFRQTAGEIGALLLESQLIKQLAPPHNRRLRRQAGLCAWRLAPGSDTPELVYAHQVDFGQASALFGPFVSKARAEAGLRELADAHQLCHRVLGLEKADGRRACFAYQIKRCKGACLGEESRAAHAERLRAALAPHAMRAWPYAGPIAVVEQASHTRDERQWHVIDNWSYLGSARDEAGVADVLAAAPPVVTFDRDVHDILARHLGAGKARVVELGQGRGFCLAPPPAAAPRAPRAARQPRTRAAARRLAPSSDDAAPAPQLAFAFDTADC